MDIVIIDYGMGNLRNVQKAFEHIGVPARISAEPKDLDCGDGLVLPGVGAFGDAMDNLRAGDLVFFHPPTYKSHTGIYLGEGEFLHVSENKGVTVSKMDEKYWLESYQTARRVLP